MTLKSDLCKYYGKDEITIGDILKKVIPLSIVCTIAFIGMRVMYTHIFIEKYSCVQDITFIEFCCTVFFCGALIACSVGFMVWYILDFIKWIIGITVIKCKKE